MGEDIKPGLVWRYILIWSASAVVIANLAVSLLISATLGFEAVAAFYFVFAGTQILLLVMLAVFVLSLMPAWMTITLIQQCIQKTGHCTLRQTAVYGGVVVGGLGGITIATIMMLDWGRNMNPANIVLGYGVPFFLCAATGAATTVLVHWLLRKRISALTTRDANSQASSS